VDDEKRLLGVVLPEAVEIAGHKQADKQFLGLSFATAALPKLVI